MNLNMRQHPANIDDPVTHRHGTIQIELDRRFLRGLLAEWENALWLLPASLRRMLNKPFFSISEIPGRLGSWDYQKREIIFNRELIHDGRWDDVKEVLLHEMAHQVAHEGFRAMSESAHGKKFQDACRLLRANPKASGTYRSLHERLHMGETLSQRDKIVTKIHKLLALAESTNLNEAYAAMQKAHELILRHNVELIKDDTQQNYHCIFLGKPRLRHFRETYHLAHLLQDFYFVQGVWIQAWVLEKEKMGRVLEISGTRSNVQIAEYVYDSVRRFIEMNWDGYRQGKKFNRYRKTDFAVGVIDGFRTTLKKAAPSGIDSGGTSLPEITEDHALTSFVTQRYPNIRSFSRRSPGHDKQVRRDGRKKGRQLIVAKGITHKEGYRERFLPATNE